MTSLSLVRALSSFPFTSWSCWLWHISEFEPA